MRKVKKSIRRRVALPIMCSLLLAACNDTSNETSQDPNNSSTPEEKKTEISIMTMAHNTVTPQDDSSALLALEEYTGVDIDMQWVPATNYDDKFNVTLAAGDLPDVILTSGKIPGFVKAVQDGAFWEVGPYLKDYKNLSQANEVVLNNSSINGKVYGVYRARALGRFGISLRKDWLQNLGLEKPTTIDEFYNVLKAFSNDDPDGNGKDDTTGLLTTKNSAAWDMMQIWFGAPNKWGVDEEGKLYPAFETEEYIEALKFFHKLYKEGLINEDFAVADGATDMMVNGDGGVFLGVIDEGHRIQEKIIAANPENTDPIAPIGAVEGPEGLRSLPTSGFAGMLAIPKTSVKTEEELKEVLAFLDKLNDKEAQILAFNGVEGKHYELVDGNLSIIDKDNAALVGEYQDLNQMLMFIPEERNLTPEPTPLRAEEAEVVKANMDIVVANPAEAFISDVYGSKGPQLDNIINDARIKFIVGQIDEAELKEAIKLWHTSGGDEYIKEMNELYAESQK